MLKRLTMLALTMALACTTMAWSADEEPYPSVEWKPLFNGQDFKEFRQLNGQAPYEVKDGVVVGTTKLGEPNSFMATKKMYGDFVLEYEFKVDERMNSGVQIRSNSFPTHNKGRVHGYQVEIDPSARAWTAGIYDEARRAWLYKLDTNKAAGEAFKHEDWNKVRVVAVGPSLKTWLNGVPAADLNDTMTPAGFIALQVHAVSSSHTEPMQVMWRNLRIKDLDRAGKKASIAGPWKGATSEASAGIYAQVAQGAAKGEFTAKLFDKPEMDGAPLAELTGKQQGKELKLTGGDWTATIAAGRMNGKRAGEKPLTFWMMPGAYGNK